MLRSMRFALAALFLFIVSVSAAVQQTTYSRVVPASSADSIVFVTNTGLRYHRDGCKWLYKSKIPVSLKQARDAGYTPCRVCYKAPI